MKKIKDLNRIPKFTLKVDGAITRVSKCISMSTCDGGYRQKRNNDLSLSYIELKC